MHRCVTDLDSDSPSHTILSPERWQNYILLFEEFGMEVYETIGRITVNEDTQAVQDGGKLQSLLELREIQEQLHQQLFSVHEVMAGLSLADGQRCEIVGNWLNHVRETVTLLTDERPEEIVKRYRPWEL